MSLNQHLQIFSQQFNSLRSYQSHLQSVITEVYLLVYTQYRFHSKLVDLRLRNSRKKLEISWKDPYLIHRWIFWSTGWRLYGPSKAFFVLQVMEKHSIIWLKTVVLILDFPSNFLNQKAKSTWRELASIKIRIHHFQKKDISLRFLDSDGDPFSS